MISPGFGIEEKDNLSFLIDHLSFGIFTDFKTAKNDK
jgi:hypothetical protein